MNNEQGKCLKCGKENLDYGTIEVQDEMIYYPFTCLECGATGKEWYSIEFLENTLDDEGDEENE